MPEPTVAPCKHGDQPPKFRSCASQTLALTAVTALVFGAVQPYVIHDPSSRPEYYIGYWTTAAILAATFLCVEVGRRSRVARIDFGEDRFFAVGRQLAPVGLAGAATTLAFLAHHPEAAPLLPGLWQIILSLGLFGAAPAHPRILTAIGVFYLLTGLICLSQNDLTHSFPFEMAVPFVGGQLLASVLVHRENRLRQ